MITKEQYDLATQKVEELLPIVNDTMPLNDPRVVELSLMSDIVIAYEKEHFPIEKPTVAELINLGIEEEGITQKQLAKEMNISPSRISEFVSGKAEPSLKMAGRLCRRLKISPAAMLML